MTRRIYQDLSNEFLGKVGAANITRGTGGNVADFRKTLGEQNKKLSQLIAKSWLPDKYTEGKDFRDILLDTDENKTDQERTKDIVKFLKTQGIEIADILEPLLGRPVNIKVSWETFAGDIREGDVYVLPYPPKPSIPGFDKQLEDWINDTRSDNILPDAPYIPLTCC
jgi:hypothetical protein